jgi:DNA/RNA-binding domain of Phe-tRNA-synthetase-like protein
MDITIELPSVVLGVVEADGVTVAPAAAEQARELDEICAGLRARHTVESVAAHESVAGVRQMFRTWGVDPARYRPSGEALLRRVVQGKGLYRVSNVVDLNNLISVETGWPWGSYDRGRITPPVAFRVGRDGESYEGIGKQTWHAAGRPVLADAGGPFGSPISDSVRTMITAATTTVVSVAYVPAATADAALREALERHAERLARFAGAASARTAILRA